MTTTQSQPPDLTTKEGLREFALSSRLKRPEKPSLSEYKRWSSSRREALDDARLDHIARVVIKTQLLNEPLQNLKRRVKFNTRLGPGPRPGAVIDSPGGGYGKSTFLHELMRWWIRECVTSNPSGRTRDGHEHIPVVYITLDAGTTVKSMMATLAHALYYPWDASSSEAALIRKAIGGTRIDRTALIQNALISCGTSLIVVDDLHFLHVNRVPDKLVNEQMKKLASTVPATFVCAGINCLNTGLLWDGLSVRDRQWSQTAGRFQRIEAERFRQRSPEWRRVVKALSDQVVLMKAPANPLIDLSDYLYERSNGEIGPLVQLIREGVEAAISGGAETLTESLLDSVTLSYSSELQRESKRGKPRRQTTSAAA